MSIYGKLTVGSKLLRVISQLLIMSKLYNVIFFFWAVLVCDCIQFKCFHHFFSSFFDNYNLPASQSLLLVWRCRHSTFDLDVNFIFIQPMEECR